MILVNQGDVKRSIRTSLAALASRLSAWQTGQGGEKGPDARRRPKAAGEAYFLYVEPAAEGANEAAGPLSAAWRLSVVPGGRPPASPGSDAKRADFARASAITQLHGNL